MIHRVTAPHSKEQVKRQTVGIIFDYVLSPV